MLPGCARMPVFMPICKQPCCPDVPGCLCLCLLMDGHAARMCPDACVYEHWLAAMKPGCARMFCFMLIYGQPCCPDVPGCVVVCSLMDSRAARMGLDASFYANKLPRMPPDSCVYAQPTIPDAQKPSPDAPGCFPGIPELKVLKRHMCPGCLANGGESTTNVIVRGEGGALLDFACKAVLTMGIRGHPGILVGEA